MAASTEVVLADLTAMAGRFRREGSAYAAQVDSMTPSPVDSGDDGLNAILGAVMQLIEVLNTALVRSIDSHADRMVTARDAYDNQELDNRFLYDELVLED